MTPVHVEDERVSPMTFVGIVIRRAVHFKQRRWWWYVVRQRLIGSTPVRSIHRRPSVSSYACPFLSWPTSGSAAFRHRAISAAFA